MFAKAREKARQSSCLSNVKQLMLGVMQYAQDYDETLPSCWTYRTSYYEHPWWFEKIEPYLKNTQIITCPSAKANYPGYGMNYIHFGPQASAGVSLGQIQRPSENLFLADSNGSYECIYASEPPPAAPTSHYGHTYGECGCRHNDGANLGFCDGHAKWFKNSSLDDYRLWANVP